MFPCRRTAKLPFFFACIYSSICSLIAHFSVDGFAINVIIQKDRNIPKVGPLHLLVKEDDISLSRENDSGSHLVFPGGGIFFYWQAGVVMYLREHDYDLQSCSFSGASAGALTATLAAGDVDFYEATDLALKLAADAGVWDRKGGLQGIWGPLIEEWLDTLLPSSLEDIEGRLSLLVTPVPSFGKSKISSFIDKKDLIQCNLASVHLVRKHMDQLWYLVQT